MPRLHLTPALYLPELDQELVRELWTLDPEDGWFAPLMRRPRPALVVLARVAGRPAGWAIAERSGLVGVYVDPQHRRQGIGARCLRRVYAAAGAQWPSAERYALPPDRRGRRFFMAFGFTTVAREAVG